jgi:hypothetical protein
MKSSNILKIAFYPVLLMTLAGCTLPIQNQAPPQAVNPNYTAAAETIAAQLTEISGGGTNIPSLPVDTSIDTTMEAETTIEGEIPTETLPNTSTPLPSNTPLPSDTPTITLTPTITQIPTDTLIPTPTTGNPLSGLGDPDFQDKFASATNWNIGSDEHAAIELRDGTLRMTALNADKYEAMRLANPVLDDFYLEVTARTGDCSGFDRYGLLARTPGFNPIQGYLFGFTCDGRYSLRIFDGVSFTILIPWIQSEDILSGSNQTNKLGFYALGQQIKLYANDKLLMETQDDRFSGGYFGLFIGAFSTPGFTVSISDVKYWELP